MRIALNWLLAVTLLDAQQPSAPAVSPSPPPPAETAAASRTVVTTRSALERYALGQHDEAVRGRPMLLRFDARDAERWIGSARSAGVERRRLAAALFALEYAAARPSLMPLLFIWGRGILREAGAPPAIETLWLRASIALGEGYDRWTFLFNGSQTANKADPTSRTGHLVYARQRFPDDPHFKMAEAVGAEVLASRPLDLFSAPPRTTPLGFDQLAAETIAAGGPRVEERTRALERAAVLFEQLLPLPALAAEAHLRLGYVRLRQGQHDAALGHFDRAGTLTSAPSHRYMAYLFAGWTLAGLGRAGEAASSYRAALRVVPRAQSATSLLISLLIRNSQLAEAEQAVTEFFAGPAPADPWQAYLLGDFFEYQEIVAKLREAMR
jgi:tetratricopeptide (TPR) repeat protein